MQWTHRCYETRSQADVLGERGLMDAIGISACGEDELSRRFPNDICVCYFTAVGMCLRSGLEFHQDTVMVDILFVF